MGGAIAGRPSRQSLQISYDGTAFLSVPKNVPQKRQRGGYIMSATHEKSFMKRIINDFHAKLQRKKATTPVVAFLVSVKIP